MIEIYNKRFKELYNFPNISQYIIGYCENKLKDILKPYKGCDIISFNRWIKSELFVEESLHPKIQFEYRCKSPLDLLKDLSPEWENNLNNGIVSCYICLCIPTNIDNQLCLIINEDILPCICGECIYVKYIDPYKSKYSTLNDCILQGLEIYNQKYTCNKDHQGLINTYIRAQSEDITIRNIKDLIILNNKCSKIIFEYYEDKYKYLKNSDMFAQRDFISSSYTFTQFFLDPNNYLQYLAEEISKHDQNIINFIYNCDISNTYAREPIEDLLKLSEYYENDIITDSLCIKDNYITLHESQISRLDDFINLIGFEKYIIDENIIIFVREFINIFNIVCDSHEDLENHEILEKSYIVFSL